MKKLIFLLSIIVFAVGLSAQDDTYYFKRSTDTYMYIAPAETITTGDSIYILDVDLKRSFPYVIDAYASIDSLKYTANDTIFCTLQGKIFEGQSWTDINTQNLKLPAANNKVTWSQVAALYRYRYLRFYLHSKDSDTNWKVNYIELKVNPGNLTDEVN